MTSNPRRAWPDEARDALAGHLDKSVFVYLPGHVRRDKVFRKADAILAVLSRWASEDDPRGSEQVVTQSREEL